MIKTFKLDSGDTLYRVESPRFFWERDSYSVSKQYECVTWLCKNIGKRAPDQSDVYFSTGGVWFNTVRHTYFKNERDAVLFTLRWS